MTPAALVRTARLSAGLTQRELADWIGVFSVTVSRWETGARAPTWEHLVAVCAACGCVAHLTLSRDGVVVAP